MKPAALLLLALPLFAPAPADAAKPTRETLTFKGQERRFFLYVPDAVAAAPGTKVPLVLVLHEGRGQADDIVDRWKKQADESGLVVAGVQALDKAAWSFVSEPPALFRQVVDAAAAKAPVDPRRVFLFGNWDGGVHAMSLALIESEYFAAVAVHAGAYPVGGYGFLDIPKRKLPILILMGNQEEHNSIRMSVVRGTEEQMRQRGIPVEVNVLRGHDNFYGDTYGRINRLAWDFLTQHPLPGEPVYRDFQLNIQIQH